MGSGDLRRQRESLDDLLRVCKGIRRANDQRKFLERFTYVNDTPSNGICYYCKEQIFTKVSGLVDSCPHCFREFGKTG